MKQFKRLVCSFIAIAICFSLVSSPLAASSKTAQVIISGIKLNTPNTTLAKGKTTKLIATITPANASNKKLTWSSSNVKAATVDSSGTVKGIGAGKAVISAMTTDKSYKMATCVVTVIVPISVKGVKTDKAKINVIEGSTVYLTPIVSPSNATNKSVSWSSSDSCIAKVDSIGRVTGIISGTATVTVITKDGGLKANCKVTVQKKPEISPYANSPVGVQVEQSIDKYCPEGNYILEKVSVELNKSVSELIAPWAKNSDVFEAIDTSVHEDCHNYQVFTVFDTYNPDTRTWLTNRSHIIDTQLYLVTYDENNVFKSEEATGDLPESLKTFRWETYVAPRSSSSANDQGAYGLLNEFEAYYYGNKAVYDTYRYLLELPYLRDNWLDYYAALDGTAFYEFKFFILTYLIYAKANHIDTYNSIMNDSKFKTVFKYIYTNYKNYVETQKPARVDEMLSYLQSLGQDASYEDNTLTIGNTGTSSGAKVDKIQKEMEKPEYKAVLEELLKLE